MRIVLTLLAIIAVASCQTAPTGGSSPPGSAAMVAPDRVQSDVAAIIKGMEQARVDGLRRAGP